MHIVVPAARRGVPQPPEGSIREVQNTSGTGGGPARQRTTFLGDVALADPKGVGVVSEA